MRIRIYQATDRDELRRITIEGFDGIAIVQNVEKAIGLVGGHDWRWRKGRHVDEDVGANSDSICIRPAVSSRRDSRFTM